MVTMLSTMASPADSAVDYADHAAYSANPKSIYAPATGACHVLSRVKTAESVVIEDDNDLGSLALPDDTPATQPVEPFSKAEFYTAGAEAAATFNRELYALINKRGWAVTMGRLNTTANDAVSAIREVTGANSDMFDGSKDAVMAMHQGRQWHIFDRKRTLNALKRGPANVDEAIAQIGKLRAAADACEALLKDSKVCTDKMVDTYKELEARYKAANGK